MYPNPATDFLTVEFSGNSPETFRYTLYNSNGTLIHSSLVSDRQGNHRIPIQMLKKGNYLLQIQSETLTQTVRFIKQ